MGYTTDFEGRVSIDPPLNEKEIEYINKFADTRRMNRKNGPYYVGGTGFMGQDHEQDVIDSNQPPAGQPGLWCQWVASDDGEFIEWDGGEKFYEAEDWMSYIIDHFLCLDPIAKRDNPHFDFLQGHVLNGEIFAQGEESGDNWKIDVVDNAVTTKQGTISYE